jgi:dephospho-CoA kinase
VSRPIVIGVTGGIATGKSSVLAILREHGVETIDADTVYHQLIAPGGSLVVPIANRFGRDMIAEDGSIDRRALDALTHPAVIAAVNERIEQSDAAFVAVDAVKLIESGMADDCDSVWLVVCDPAVQRARLMARNGLTAEEADLRLAAQPNEAERRAKADIVIDNSGDLPALERQVAASMHVVKQLPN